MTQKMRASKCCILPIHRHGMSVLSKITFRQTAVSIAARAAHAEQETSRVIAAVHNHFAFWGAAQQSRFVGLFQNSLVVMAPDAKAMSLPRVLHDLTQILQSSSMEESTGTATQGEVAPRVRQMLLRLMQCCAKLDNGKQGAFNSCQVSAYHRKGMLCRSQVEVDQ